MSIALTIVRCARAADSRDWTALGECFTDDADVSFRGFNDYLGRDAIVEGCRRSLLRFAETRHLVGDCAIRMTDDGSRATSHCDVIATHLRLGESGAGLRFTIGGTYADDLVLRNGRWHIARRVLTTVWQSGDSAAMRWP